MPIFHAPSRLMIPNGFNLLILHAICRLVTPIDSAICAAVISGVAAINVMFFCCGSFIPMLLSSENEARQSK